MAASISTIWSPESDVLQLQMGNFRLHPCSNDPRFTFVGYGKKSLQVYHCSEPTNSPIFSTGRLSKETKTYNSKLWSINSPIPVCQIPVCSCLKLMLNHQNWMQPAWNPVLTTSMCVCGTKYPQFVLDKIPTCCEMISVHLVILVLMDNILVYQYDSLT